MKNRKFEFTGETKKYKGYTLHRIICTQGFWTEQIEALRHAYVRFGEKGGWVANYDNLSQEGSCWVADEAIVCGNAKVTDRAVVMGKSVIEGKVTIDGRSVISGSPRIRGNSTIRDSIVMGMTTIFVESPIENAEIICYPNEVE